VIIVNFAQLCWAAVFYIASLGFEAAEIGEPKMKPFWIIALMVSSMMIWGCRSVTPTS
jgi:hypothetical protein